MSHRVGLLVVIFALALAGCGGDDPSDSAPDPTSASTTCPNGEDSKGADYDVGENPRIREATAVGAVTVFLDQTGSDLSADDFEPLDKANDDRKATFVYNDGELDLARINVRQLEGGWVVDSYEFCQGVLTGDRRDAEARGDVPPQFCPDPGGPGGSDTTLLFNANELIGLKLDEAEAQAKSRGCSVRVVEEDGEPLVGTSDLRPDRINVAIADGKVARIDGVY